MPGLPLRLDAQGPLHLLNGGGYGGVLGLGGERGFIGMDGDERSGGAKFLVWGLAASLLGDTSPEHDVLTAGGVQVGHPYDGAGKVLGQDMSQDYGN